MFDLSGLNRVAFGVFLFRGPLTILEGFIYLFHLACLLELDDCLFFLFFYQSFSYGFLATR